MNEYTVTINGIEHTMQLSDEDADRLSAQQGIDVKKGGAANKARTASNK